MKYNSGVNISDGGWLNLHRNENLFIDQKFLNSLIIEVVKATNINEYPDSDALKLKSKLSELHKVTTDNIFIGNGADEVLESLFFLFRKECDEVNIPRISFKMYESLAAKYDYKVNYLNNLPPINPVINWDEISKNKGLFFIDSPCSLTGLALDKKIFSNLLAKHDNFIIYDNVYGDYCDPVPTGVKENLIVLRHFAKFYGLSSLRIGYCIGPKEIIEKLNFYKQPFNVNSIAQGAAVACLDKHDYFAGLLPEVIDCKTIFQKQLKDLNFLFSNGLANFMLVRHKNISSEYIFQKLMDKKIAVRNYTRDSILKEYLRFAIPPRKEINRVILALKEIIKNKNK